MNHGSLLVLVRMAKLRMKLIGVSLMPIVHQSTRPPARRLVLSNVLLYLCTCIVALETVFRV